MAGALGAVPATASATGSTTTPTTPSSTSTAATPPAATPPKATPKLYVSGLSTVKRAEVTVPGRDVTITGVVTPYVAGQTVVLEAFEGSHRFKTETLRLKPSKKSVYGGFRISLAAPTAGTVTIRIKHVRTTGLLSFVAIKRYTVLSESVHLGSTGAFIDLLQSRLAALHLYIPQTGVFDEGTELALDTYHRLLGWGEGDVSVDAKTVTDLLNGVGAFHVKYPKQGYHAEGDLSDQVLAYINGDTVQYLLPISSGKPSTPTVLGEYQVYRKQPNYTSDGMYFSNFFTGGYAIHGYNPAPDYPASHGCMRIPIADAIFAYGLLNVGDWVDTYYT